jgi:phage terminase large subunit
LFSAGQYDQRRGSAISGRLCDQMDVANRRVRVMPSSNRASRRQTIFGKCYFDAEKCADDIQGLRHYRYKVDKKLGGLRKEPPHDWARTRPMRFARRP